MQRLLCVIAGMTVGGAETFLMKVYRKLDKTKYQIDFAVAMKEKCEYDDEIESLGGKIYHIPRKTDAPIANFKAIKKIVKEGHYNCVMRTSENSLSAIELLAAKLGGARVRVFRSSNTRGPNNNFKEKAVHSIFRLLPRMFANVKIAPSTEAAEFMFGKNCIKNGKAELLHNGIDLSSFRYDEKARSGVRKEFGIENRTVVGHIGRFNQQKNHKFLLDVFSEIVKLDADAVLMLVGQGKLEEEIKAYAGVLGILDKIVFTGIRNNVPELLSAMDVFVFPSLYEGMPNTVIEAQATGLPCVISDKITKEAAITPLVEYLPLTLTAQEWAEKALSVIMPERPDTSYSFTERQYDIDSVVNRFTELIFNK